MKADSLRSMPMLKRGTEASSDDRRPSRVGVTRIRTTSARIERTMAPRIHTSRSMPVAKSRPGIKLSRSQGRNHADSGPKCRIDTSPKRHALGSAATPRRGHVNGEPVIAGEYHASVGPNFRTQEMPNTAPDTIDARKWDAA